MTTTNATPNIAATHDVATLRAAVARAHEPYQQYHGHFDAWVRVRVNVRFCTKAGVGFEEGDVALAEPRSELTFWRESRRVYSARTGVVTVVPFFYVIDLYDGESEE